MKIDDYWLGVSPSWFEFDKKIPKKIFIETFENTVDGLVSFGIEEVEFDDKGDRIYKDDLINQKDLTNDAECISRKNVMNHREGRTVAISDGFIQKYDNENRIVEIIITNKYVNSRTVYKYSNDGDLSGIVEFDGKGEVVSKTEIICKIYKGMCCLDGVKVYRLNENGEIIRKSWYNSENALMFEWVFTCDYYGNLVEELFANPDGSIDKKTVVKYIY